MSTTISRLDADQYATLLKQIGRMNILAICGGKLYRTDDNGIEMPCGAGFRVRVIYDRASDTYTVERVFVRGGKVFPKGKQERVYADQVGEFAYYASCFRMDDGNWTYMG